MMRASHLFPTLLLAAAGSPLLAQNLSLDQTGGAIGGLANFRVQAQANDVYAIVFDFKEQVTPIPALGITLQISDDFAGNSFLLPGFFGVASAQGVANASLLLPNDPSIGNLTISLQAVAGQSTFRVSNLLRLTPQLRHTWKAPLNQPPVPIVGGTTAVAANNEILFCGGSGPVAQLYKSRTEEWATGGATFGVGLLSQSTALADGRILFTGGLDLTGQPTDAAALYDPVAGTTITLTMANPRIGHGASLMGNGKVLITGGLRTFDFTNLLALFAGIQQTTEVFDPATNSFTAGPNMLEARALHTSTTLTSGQVLIAGGLTLIPIVNVPTVSATAYRFNPATNSFGFPAVFSGARFLHSAAPTSNGKVLLAGGLTLDLTQFLQTGQIQDLVIGTRSDCQLYTPAIASFGTFATVNGMQQGRAGAAIAPLANGGAVIAGGFTLTINASTNQFELGATDSTDVFAQSPNGLTPAGAMAAPRLFPITVTLPDGTVMVVGGGPTGAEIFQN